MKKMLFATAALLSVTGGAVAQSNVTIYGMADMGIDRQMGGAAGDITKLSSGIQLGSRLGFKGTEDLGGGMSALFLMEMGMAVDTGASTQGGLLFGRQIYVGLSSGAGKLTFGRQYSAVNNSLCEIDPFGCGLAGTAENLMSGGSKAVSTGGSGGARMNNAIKYATPVMGGFNGELSYSLGEVAGNSSASRMIDGSVRYANGPLTATLAHNNINDATATSSGKVTFLGAKYNFGVAALSLGVAVNKGSFTANANIVNPDSRDYLVGVAVPVGAGTILASYIKKQDKSGGNNDVNQIGVGYTHALSKRTNLYTAYARISNARSNSVGNAGGFYTVGNALDPGTGDKAFNVGIRHSF